MTQPPWYHLPMLPACTACPRCGNAEHHKVKPRSFVYFKVDRLCTKCPTYYSPPTPIWASVLFIVLGGGMAVIGLPLLFLGLQKASSFAVLFYGGVLSAIGLLCAVQGIRYLLQKRLQPPHRAIPVEPVAPMR
jgi:hypothetical protein